MEDYQKFTPSQKLLLFQCAIHFCNGATAVPAQMVLYKLRFQMNCSMSFSILFFAIFTPGIGIITLSLLVVIRYRAIVQQTQITGRRILLYLAVPIIIHTFSSSWQGFIINHLHMKQYFVLCILSDTVLGIMIMVATIFNVKLRRFVRNTARCISCQDRKSNSYEKHATNTILIMSTVLIICYIPLIIALYVASFLFFSHTAGPEVWMSFLIAWPYSLVLINSGISSLIYCTRTKRISRFYRSIFVRSGLCNAASDRKCLSDASM